MKACPHCEAELRDSVIRCTRCGKSLKDAPDESGGASVSDANGSPAPAAAPASSSSSVATKTATAWTTPASLSRPHAAPADMAALRAMPAKKTSSRPDPWMLLAGLATAIAGILAYLAVKDPWVHLTVTQPARELEEAIVVELTLRGQAAFVGTVGTVLGIALAGFGCIWFFYGFQRGWTIPGLFNPAIAMLCAVVGLLATVLSSMVWFVWQDAAIARAKVTGLSTRAMTELLGQQPVPIVTIERLGGLFRFGGMMVAGLLATCLAWYAYRQRD